MARVKAIPKKRISPKKLQALLRRLKASPKGEGLGDFFRSALSKAKTLGQAALAKGKEFAASKTGQELIKAAKGQAKKLGETAIQEGAKKLAEKADVGQAAIGRVASKVLGEQLGSQVGKAADLRGLVSKASEAASSYLDKATSDTSTPEQQMGAAMVRMGAGLMLLGRRKRGGMYARM